MNTGPKSKTASAVLLVVFLLVAAFAGGYYYYREKEKDTILDVTIGDQKITAEIDHE